jgi:hypothetical protein
VDWNSRLTIARGTFLRHFPDRHSCFIHGPDSPTTVPYIPSENPDFLGIEVNQNHPTLAHLTACSALSKDHLPILIDTRCPSFLVKLPDRRDFRWTDWSKPVPKPVTKCPTEDSVPGPMKRAEKKKLAPKTRTPKRATGNGTKRKVDTTQVVSHRGIQ